jgi:RHS repeat-associated protein
VHRLTHAEFDEGAGPHGARFFLVRPVKGGVDVGEVSRVNDVRRVEIPKSGGAGAWHQSSTDSCRNRSSTQRSRRRALLQAQSYTDRQRPARRSLTSVVLFTTARRVNWGVRHMSDLFRRVVAVTLASLLLFPMSPVRAETAIQAQTNTYAAPDVSSSTLSVAHSATAANGLKAPEVPVSAQGNFQTSVQIVVPPGRAGMTPSLALTYDSGGSKQASTVGAGWSLSISEVARSTTNGYPKISRATTGLKYADAPEEGALFAWAGLDLAKLPDAATLPDRVWADSSFYAPLRGTDASVLEYSQQQDAWVAHYPDGRKDAFGKDPQDQYQARVVNELGTFRWLLVRQWNANSDRVVYRYHQIEQQTRSNKANWQDEPIVKTITWGGNDKVAGADPFAVEVEVKVGSQSETSALRGNVRTGGLLASRIASCGPIQKFSRKSGSVTVGTLAGSGLCVGRSKYREYVLEHTRSEDSGRDLLSAVSEVVPGVSSGTFSSRRDFSYTTNDGKIAFSPPVLLTENDALRFLGAREQRGDGNPPASTWSRYEAYTPLMSSAGAKFVDANGDGRTDIVYHPAGLNSPSAGVVDFALPTAQGNTEQGGVVTGYFKVPLYGGQPVARSALKNGLGYAPFQYGRLSEDIAYSDIVNVDSDGVADGVAFPTHVTGWFARSGRGQCFSEAFWRMCGVIDPYEEPPADMCDLDSSCEEMTRFDVSMCFDGACWIDESLFIEAFDDLHDWVADPPSSETGLDAIDNLGIEVSSDGFLYRVSEGELRQRLGLRGENLEIFDDAFWKSAFATSGTGLADQCGAMMEWCQATRHPGPPIRVDIEWDRTISCSPAERAAASSLPNNSLLPGIDCRTDISIERVCLDGLSLDGGPCRSESGAMFSAGVMRVAVHSTSTPASRGLPRLPLDVWPSTAGKELAISSQMGFELPPYFSRTVSDFEAPIVDINGDGRADIVLLRSMTTILNKENGKNEPFFSFAPRAYLQVDADRRYDDYDFAFRSDWVKARGRLTAGPILDGSEFTESLNRVLVGDVNLVSCPFGVCDTQENNRFLLGAGYNSLLQDVNADGLPDLIVGRRDAVLGGCTGEEPDRVCNYTRSNFNANPGHDVFLNRGYRFGIDLGTNVGSDPRFVGTKSPWEKIIKGDLTPRNTSERPTFGNLIPMGMTSMADINADGRSDVVAWFRPREVESVALEDGSGATGETVLEVDLNQGDGYVRRLNDSLVVRRPCASGSCTEPLSEYNGLSFGEALRGAPGAVDSEAFTRRLLAGDVARFDDVNDDGLVDIYIPGEACAGRCHDPMIGGGHLDDEGYLYPSRVMYNAGVHPDLLIEVADVAGSLTSVDYVAARNESSVVAPSEYVPGGKIVVSGVEVSVAENTFRHVELSYGRWMRAKSADVSLGFERVTATATYGSPEGTRGPVIATTYYTDDSEGDYARRGLAVSEEVEAAGEFSVVEKTYTLARPYGDVGVFRLDLDEVTTTSCKLTSGICEHPVVSKREVTGRTEFGFIQQVREGDVVDGEFADHVISIYKYDQMPGIWSLGLISQADVVGRNYGFGSTAQMATLQQQTAKYDAFGRLVESVDVDVTSTACGSLDGVFKVLSFDGVGNPAVISRNGTQVETTYDGLNLYPVKVRTKVGAYVDGVATGALVDLVSEQQVDVRSAQVWTSIDPNGAVVEQQYDGVGRKTNSYDANGALTASATYDLYGTQSSEVVWFSTTAGRRVVTTSDAVGNLVKKMAYDRSNGVDSNPIRLAFNVVDTEGAVYKAYQPEMTAADPTGTSPVVVSTYDAFGRMETQVAPGGRISKVSYAPRETLFEDALGVTTYTATDWRGNVTDVWRTDGFFGLEAGDATSKTSWLRDGLGRLVKLTDADGNVQQFEYDNGSHLTRWNLPHAGSAASGTFSQCFDAEGNVTSFSDPDGRTVHTTYDTLSRPVVVNIKDDLSATPVKYTMSYDKAGSNRLGRQWRSTDPLGSTEQVYDANGRPTTALRVLTAALGGITKLTTVSTWGQQGEVKTAKVYGGDTTAPLIGDLSLTYTGAGRVSAVKDGTTELVGGLAFDAFEKPTTFKVGATPTVAADRITALINRDPGTRDLTGLAYSRPGRILTSLGLAGYNGYGAPGSETRTGTSDSAGSGVSVSKLWGYDTFGRLAKEKVTKGSTVVFNEAYTYSLGGRLLTAGGATETYKYNRNDLPGAVTDVVAAAPRTLTYHNSGAVKTDKKGTETRTASFSALGCLRRFQSSTGAKVEQVCDVAGNPLLRTSTTAAGVKTTVMNFGFSELRSEDKLMVHRIPVAGLVTMELAYATTGGRKDGASKIIMSDGRGSVLAVAPLLGTTGANVDASQDFDAWGKPIAIGAAKPKHGYVDHEPDAVFGTYAFGRRVYDPQLRRWLSADPLIGANPEVDIEQNTQLDLWGYAGSNPVLSVDRNGMCIDDACFDRVAASQKKWSPEASAAANATTGFLGGMTLAALLSGGGSLIATAAALLGVATIENDVETPIPVPSPASALKVVENVVVAVAKGDSKGALLAGAGAGAGLFAAARNPAIRRLHGDSSLKPTTLEHYRKQSTEQIVKDLKTPGADQLKLRPDGTVLDGNHRIKVLEERGYDTSTLWDGADVIPKSGGFWDD